MTFGTLILRSLRFHARSHVGVVLGAAVGSAALIGALVVGDSVRGSLQDLALQRLGEIHYAMAPNDRVFRAEPISVSQPFTTDPTIRRATGNRQREYDPLIVLPALRLPASASAGNGAWRANRVQLLGISEDIWKLGGGPELTNLATDEVALNQALADQLQAKAGDTVLLRVRKPTALSQD